MEEDFFTPVQAEPGSAGAEITANMAKNLFGIDVSKLPSTKPDGTAVLPVDVSKNLPVGGVKNTTGVKTEGATNPIEGGKGTVDQSSPTETHPNPRHNLQNLVKNPLEDFAHYSPLWTLAVLTPEMFNKPENYRTDDLSFAGYFDDMNMSTGQVSESSIIFSSGGRGDEYRTNTKHGAPEYFINNFTMNCIIAPTSKTGNTNAFKFEFDVIEPYSMGLFLQSLQNAALKAGHTDYLSAPYVLRLDIKGWDERGKILSTIKPKYFVLKLTKASFSVDEGGSKYRVEAVPYNHEGLSDVTQTMYKDISLTATKKGTVEELLVAGPKSLCAQLNDNEKKLVEQKKISVPDIYEIHFPVLASENPTSTGGTETDSGATRSTSGASQEQKVTGTPVASSSQQDLSGLFGKNPFGQSDFGFDATRGGNFTFKNEKDVIDEKTGRIKRDAMEIDVNKRTFFFTQNQTITSIINQVITSSTFAKTQIAEAKIDGAGMITWFRIDAQMEYLDFDPLIGDYARKIIYRVVPYRVHHTVFSNATSAAIGYDQLAKAITKSYDYIYTGQNADILKFDIQINNLFFVGTMPSAESSTRQVANPDQQGAAPDPGRKTETPEGKSPEVQTGNLGRARPRKDPKLLQQRLKGGAGAGDTEQMVAEAFHSAFINGASADLVSVNLEILGDPYWLVDSGFANYFSTENAASNQITNDGTANYEGGDVYIYLSFRTPADVNTSTGLYDFSNLETESPFSGIYKVTKVTNTFNNGTFTQELRCLRMKGQPSEFDGATQTKGDPKDTMPTKLGKDNALPTDVTGKTTGTQSGSDDTDYD